MNPPPPPDGDVGGLEQKGLSGPWWTELAVAALMSCLGLIGWWVIR